MNKWLVLASLAIAVNGGMVQAEDVAGSAEAGKAKAGVCGGCHGADGNSANTIWPSLAGQHQAYLQKQIHDFKKEARKDPMMSAQAANITDQDIADLTAYFSAQPLNPGFAKPEAVALGEQVYRGGNPKTGVPACSGCHSPTGMGNLPAKFPRLSGQNVGYVAKALKDFRSGTRANGPMMVGVAANMTDAEIDAVAEYVHGLTAE
ncbi:cytochrome C [Achromatium sp. WMS2]|nr:cytochrome C [Achromatium sp. WMS2]